MTLVAATRTDPWERKLVCPRFRRCSQIAASEMGISLTYNLPAPFALPRVLVHTIQCADLCFETMINSEDHIVPDFGLSPCEDYGMSMFPSRVCEDLFAVVA